jgi:hypothetical protein
MDDAGSTLTAMGDVDLVRLVPFVRVSVGECSVDLAPWEAEALAKRITIAASASCAAATTASFLHYGLGLSLEQVAPLIDGLRNALLSPSGEAERDALRSERAYNAAARFGVGGPEAPAS